LKGRYSTNRKGNPQVIREGGGKRKLECPRKKKKDERTLEDSSVESPTISPGGGKEVNTARLNGRISQDGGVGENFSLNIGRGSLTNRGGKRGKTVAGKKRGDEDWGGGDGPLYFLLVE